MFGNAKTQSFRSKGSGAAVQRCVTARLFPVTKAAGVGKAGQTFGITSENQEVTTLVLGDWQRLAQEMPPDTPVIFRYDGQGSMENEDYCDGLRVQSSHMWEGHSGWVPCVLVVLGERF